MAGEEIPLETYFRKNNASLDFVALESRLADILQEQEAAPVTPMALPSQQASTPGVFRRLLLRLRSSAMVREWLPRHPHLYRVARAAYRCVKKLKA